LKLKIFNLEAEQEWQQVKQVEKVLGKIGGGDVAGAYWEPGQISPYHSHPEATEIYICMSGGGEMRTPERVVKIVPGTFVVHPPGELHEYINGPERTILFRVRYGANMKPRFAENRQLPAWQQSPEDADYFKANLHVFDGEMSGNASEKKS
jgi:quercetin dioxygenase-like cupin family protein